MRLVGVNIPDEKKINIALTYIYGVGRASSATILKEAKVDGGKLAKELDPAEVNRIKETLEKKHKIEGELRQIIKQNINRLRDIKAYRGIRHIKRLPVRGQRTKTNSRTIRGNVRKTAGSGRKKTELK